MKRTMLFLLSIIASSWLIALSGCKKNPIVQGQVVEFGTNTPIPNATVKLSECDGEVLGSFLCTNVGSTTTDDKGNFSFDLEGFQVSADANKYWESGDDFEVLQGKEGCYDRVTISLFPYAWLKVTLKNESGAYAFDPPSNFSGNPLIYLTQNQDTVFELIKVKGNKEFIYSYGVYQTNGSDRIFTTIRPFCNGHDTTNLTITY
jgi:hypothetical protein